MSSSRAIDEATPSISTVLAAQEALQPEQVLLEARDRHRLLLEHLHRAVAAAEREATPARRRGPAASPSRSAARSGWRSGTATAVPTLSVVVAAAATREHDVRVGEQPVRLADREAVPAARLEPARKAARSRLHGTGVAPIRQNSAGTGASHPRRLELRDQRRDDGERVADDAEVGELEDRRVAVGVDRDHAASAA